MKSRRAEVEGKEASYEDHLSCLEELQEQACEDLEEPGHLLHYIQGFVRRRLGKIC
jgi:hypothetical protein